MFRSGIIARCPGVCAAGISGRTIANEVFFNNAQRPLIESPAGIFALTDEGIEKNNQSRGYLDYGMIWAVAVVSVILSILFYQAVTMVERRVLARAGMWGR